MLLRLTVRNLVPEISLKRVDFLGHEASESLGEHPRVTLAKACVEARPAEEQHLFMRLENLPADVNAIHIGLYMHEKDTTRQSQSAEWELKHGERRLHSGTIIHGQQPERAVRIYRLEPQEPRRADATIVLKRGPISFGANGVPLARYWTIYNVAQFGLIWNNYVSVSESDADPVPPQG